MAESSALVIDLYQLTMAQSYYAQGIHRRPATFSLFVRNLPPRWGYLVAAGLDAVLDYLEGFAFTESELGYLETTGLFGDDFLGHLEGVRFEGEVRAMLEGTLFFPNEPVLEVRAPLLEAQLVETIVLQEVHFQSLAAAKAARSVDVAEGRTLVDFGLRRGHGADAGMRVARSSYLAGFDSTSNVEAGRRYGIPIAGTMAHSYVQAFDSEGAAFRAFARSFPDRAILLVDTYDTLEGIRRAALVGRELAGSGHRLAGIRLDSGDVEALAREARTILDEAGLEDATIFVSGGLDEQDVAHLVGSGAAIDGFGIGSKLSTSADAPYLDMAYKLVELAGRSTLKLSPAKATLPGPKQVWRVSLGGRFAYDVVAPTAGVAPPGGEPLLEPAMAGGRRLLTTSLETARTRCRAQREQLAAEHRRLDAESYEVRISDALLELRDRTVAELHRAGT